MALGPARARRLPQRAEHVALGPTSVIDLLFGTLGRPALHRNRLLAGITLRGDWSHLIHVQDDAVERWGGPQRFYCPLLRANSGSRRSPNQVSCLRQRNPSSRKISKM